ncbi:MAG: bifunctional enoyl-CoA hydratase/phosphate acetyltransferase [Myxococcus sp.]|nr:bifunctional enoyl-CoA hydratase/phosphate acetyltransferase [Myxococcus sp.]
MARNTTYDELVVGATASLVRQITANDLWVFANASGNLNPLVLPSFDPDGDGHSDAVAPELWAGALISAVLGNQLPGPGTRHLAQTFTFPERARVGDTVTAQVTVKAKRGEGRATFDTRVTTTDGRVIAAGEAEVIAPATRIDVPDELAPPVTVVRHQHIERLMKACAPLEPLATAVVCPEDAASLGGALLGRAHNLIRPVLIGDVAKIREVARAMGASLDGLELVEAAGAFPAAEKAVSLVHQGAAQAVMKGRLHTDELLKPMVRKDGGLRGVRRISHVFVMDVPGLPELLLVTDAAVNIAPTLEDKVDIVQNAIFLAQALGYAQPKVGVLSAVEIVNPAMQSTLDAAVLSKMAERGQIVGGFVDGPLAMDNALSLKAAQSKGITSLVAGRANVLMVPNIEAGNMLAKELAFVAHAEGPGLVVGAKVPIMLTSRADDDSTRLASCAVAVLEAHFRRTGKSAVPST